MHVRLQRMGAHLDGRAEGRHAVLRERGLESAVGNGLRDSPGGVTAGCDGRGPCCGCVFVR